MPIKLVINDNTITFNSVDDFEFALDSRTTVPLDKFNQMLKASDDELENESNAINIAEKRLSKIISVSPESSGGLDMRLKAVDASTFSRDHNWRGIFNALNNNHSRELNSFKNIALKKYLQYLSGRQEAISSINKIELHNKEQSKNADDDISSPFMSTLDIIDKVDPGATGHFNYDTAMARMPKDKAISLKINAGESIDILIASYSCKLINKDGIVFVDSNDIEHPLKTGKNIVGRGYGSTVRLDESLREISRFHLLIVNYDDVKLELIDVSTHGTYLAPQILAELTLN